VLGEIVVTAEKLSWLIKEGEAALKPSQRGAGVMVGGSFVNTFHCASERCTSACCIAWLLKVACGFLKCSGEIVVTAEKLSCLIKKGEAALKPSQRGAGVMVRHVLCFLSQHLPQCGWHRELVLLMQLFVV
jgi:hypothetical protein